MLVLLTALIAGVIAGYLGGGRLRNLADLDLAKGWLALAALGLQVAAFSPLGQALGTSATVALHLISYALLVWFVFLNRRRVGVVIAGTGMALNLIAILSNGGYMPASGKALAFAGIAYGGDAHNNSAVIDAETNLRVLGDVFAVPAWLPTANVFSVGDVLIAAGIAGLLAASMRGPRLRTTGEHP